VELGRLVRADDLRPDAARAILSEVKYCRKASPPMIRTIGTIPTWKTEIMTTKNPT
jgi:hypothetical protein